MCMGKFAAAQAAQKKYEAMPRAEWEFAAAQAAQKANATLRGRC